MSEAKPLFDVCVIMRNSAKTLPRLFASLVDFQARGGVVTIVDTGSTDDSVAVARAHGAVVTEAGERFIHVIDVETAKAINDRFIVQGEEPVVQAGNRYFHFAEARNFCLDLATNDWVTWVDSDEAFVRLDIDKINEAMSNPEISLLEYNFCYAWQRPPEAPGDLGIPALEFVQAKTHRRLRMNWGTLPVHELITALPNPAPGGLGRAFLPKESFYLGHWQQPADHRSNYLVGLSVACYQEPDHDRESHYFGREMTWCGRPKSAIKELERHIAMNRWPAEKAQSMIFQGDCWSQLGEPEKTVAAYTRAFHTDSTRREALIKAARFYRANNNAHAAAAYASAALQIPWHAFYANDVRMYRAEPHEILYWAAGWTGDVAKAQEHLLKVFDYEAWNAGAMRDFVFYFGYEMDKAPEGYMIPREMAWLYQQAQKHRRVLEYGSWKGRSTHALCKGSLPGGGIVWAVDHFGGAADPQDLTHNADANAIYAAFLENTKDCPNLRVRRADGAVAVKDFPDHYFDCAFIDGDHRRESVREDILRWRRKVKGSGLLCGHDYSPTWPGVREAILETLGEPDGSCSSIWWKKMPPSQPNPLLAYLTDCIKTGKPTSFVKLGDGEAACMAGESGGNCDGHQYTPELAAKLKEAFEWFAPRAVNGGRTVINVVPFHDQPMYNVLLHRNDSDVDAVKAFWGAVRDADKPKVFVGPARLKPAAAMLKAEFVEVPLVNAFSEYSSVREKLLWAAKPGSIFVFTAGMTAKPWIMDVLKRESTASCIDAGSAWDPVFLGSSTRTEQLPMDFLLEHYAEWLG